jgi:tRNA (guanine-N7-)-methyltransferase
MAMRDFQLPSRPPEDAARSRGSKRSIGGSLELRRAHGHASGIEGTYLLDPVFSAADEARLQAWCAPQASPLVIEIGFQMGEFAAAYCQQRSDIRYLGFEVRRKFCEESNALLERTGVTNALLALVDAREMLPRVLQPGSVSELLVFFPDPWWKPRHIKKRLLYAEFIAQVAAWLAPGGRLLLKTDVPGYADWAENELQGVPGLRASRLADPAAGLPPTLRERRCGFHGYPTFAIEAVRV